MGHCGDCKHFDQHTCTWWLLSQEHVDPEKVKRLQCFISREEEIYPLMPKQHTNTRKCLYPTQCGHCFYCGQELTGRRRHYCSDAHAETYGSRFLWEYVRIRVWERDKTQCVQYGTILNAWEAEIDHITAIVNGGAYWDYANLRTLCKQCHKRKTKQDLHVLKRTDVNTATLELFLKGGGG